MKGAALMGRVIQSRRTEREQATGMSECPHDSRNTLKIQVMALKQSNSSGLVGKKNEQQYKKLDCTFKMQYVSVTVLLCEDPLHSSLVFSQEFSARRALVGRVVQ